MRRRCRIYWVIQALKIRVSAVRSRSWPPNRIEIGENSDFFFFIDLRIKPNTRGCFAFGEFSAVCGGNPAAGLYRGFFAPFVSPPRDFSQHDVFEGKRPFLRFPMQTSSLVCAHSFIDRFWAQRELHAGNVCKCTRDRNGMAERPCRRKHWMT